MVISYLIFYNKFGRIIFVSSRYECWNGLANATGSLALAVHPTSWPTFAILFIVYRFSFPLWRRGVCFFSVANPGSPSLGLLVRVRLYQTLSTPDQEKPNGEMCGPSPPSKQFTCCQLAILQEKGSTSK